jgi:hypothetical protein
MALLEKEIQDITWFNLPVKLKLLFKKVLGINTSSVTTTFTSGIKTITVVNGIITSVV